MEHLRDQDLQLYLDRQLEDTGKLGHLRGCPVCQERLDAYEALFASLAVAPGWSPSPALAPRVMRKIRQENADPLYQKLLQILLLVGGFIAALSLTLPYLHADEYLATARKFQLPHYSIRWDLLRELNILPKLSSFASQLSLPVNTLLMVVAVLLLVALADQFIGHARSKTATDGH